MPISRYASTTRASTSAMRAPDPRHTLTVAHRGASASSPENTLGAVRAALSRGADMVEVDVQRTKDGVLVVIHDTTLARTTNVEQVFGRRRAPWLVGDFTFDEISRLDAGRWKSPAYAGERIPTLREVTDVLLECGSRLLLELKSPALYPGIEAEVVAELRATVLDGATGAWPGTVVVQSFDETALKTVKTLEPSATVGLLARPHPSRLPEIAEWADQLNPNHRTVGTAYVKSIHNTGMECFVWTANSRSALTRAIGLGVDGIITDRPLLLQRLLGHEDVSADPSAALAATASKAR